MQNNASIHLTGFLGEFIGTFILVFFGCGSVAISVVFGPQTGLFQVAVIWGIGVALAIYTTRHISCAHLNPAVSIAMVAAGRMVPVKIYSYLAGQFAGALFAAMLVYFLFSDSIGQYEAVNNIVRGSRASIKTAMIFGEFYPNPGMGGLAVVSTLTAFIAETTGTLFLVFFIFSFTEGCNVGRPDDSLSPLFVGLAVTIIICIIAPLTQAGLNPARDLSPRLFAWAAGWGKAAFPDNFHGFITVYVMGPILGGLLAAFIFRKIIEPVMIGKNKSSGCNCENRIK
ncbi:MAG: aquaporin [Deltaproteobacteria bacterium]|nr:aquaporin [Deltaproteobacteria bacterium]